MAVEIIGNSSCYSSSHLYCELNSVKYMAQSDQYCVQKQWSDPKEPELNDYSETSYWLVVCSYIIRMICITPTFVAILFELIPVIVYSSSKIFSLVRRIAVPLEKNRTEERVNVADRCEVNLYNRRHGELSAEELALLRLLIIQLQTSFSHEQRAKVLQSISRYMLAATRSSGTMSMSRARGC